MACLGIRPCDEGVILGPPCRGKRYAHPGWILAATILGSSMAFIDGTVVNIALPTLQEELGATVADAQWVVEAYALFLAALLLLGGALGDRYGRKRVFMFGVGLFAAASVACGVARDADQLILGRAVQGVAGALLVPGSLAIISSSFPKVERGRAIGLWSGFSAISAGLGLVFGGWLLDAASWRWLFYMNVPMAAATLLIASRTVPESRAEEEQGPLDVLGATLVTVGLAGLTFGLVEASVRGWGSPIVLGPLAGGVFFLLAFLAQEIRSSNPMLPLTLFRIRSFAGANLLTLLLYAALAGSMFFFPLNLIQVQGYDATEAGAANLPFILLTFFLSRWSGGLVDRFGPRLPLVAGPLVTAAGLLLFARPGIGGSYWTTFFPAVVVMGLGMAVSVAPLTTTVMGAVEDRHAGLASGVNNATSRVAAVVAIATSGPVVLHAFTASLETRIAGLDLTVEQRASILAQSVKLGAAETPGDLLPGVRMHVAAALDEAFVDGYRTVIYVTATLAVLAALSAAALIRREPAPIPAAEPSVAA